MNADACGYVDVWDLARWDENPPELASRWNAERKVRILALLGPPDA